MLLGDILRYNFKRTLFKDVLQGDNKVSFIKIIKDLAKPLKGKLYYSSPDKEQAKDEVVVFVHGLIRRGNCFKNLAKKVATHGFSCYVYDYDTTMKHISEHGVDFNNFLVATVMAENPTAKINIVTHSLGGIVSRYALDSLSKVDAQRINKIIMLGPPNQGSDIASFVCKVLPWAKKIVLPLEDLCSGDESKIHNAPTLANYNFKIAIISGKFDWLVKREYTFMENISYAKHINCDHSFMMYNSTAQQEVIDYLCH